MGGRGKRRRGAPVLLPARPPASSLALRSCGRFPGAPLGQPLSRDAAFSGDAALLAFGLKPLSSLRSQGRTPERRIGGTGPGRCKTHTPVPKRQHRSEVAPTSSAGTFLFFPFLFFFERSFPWIQWVPEGVRGRASLGIQAERREKRARGTKGPRRGWVGRRSRALVWGEPWRRVGSGPPGGKRNGGSGTRLSRLFSSRQCFCSKLRKSEEVREPGGPLKPRLERGAGLG